MSGIVMAMFRKHNYHRPFLDSFPNLHTPITLNCLCLFTSLASMSQGFVNLNKKLMLYFCSNDIIVIDQGTKSLTSAWTSFSKVFCEVKHEASSHHSPQLKRCPYGTSYEFFKLHQALFNEQNIKNQKYQSSPNKE